MKNLGIEFYRNYIGISDPLKIEVPHEDGGYMDTYLNYCTNSYLYDEECCDEFDYDECRPYLRTIDDLSDNELSFIVCAGFHNVLFMSGIIVNRFNNGSIKVTHSTFCIKINIKYDRLGNLCFWDDNNEALDTEAMHAQLNEYHSHKRAKEYIDKGLALNYKDLVE